MAKQDLHEIFGLPSKEDKLNRLMKKRQNLVRKLNVVKGQDRLNRLDAKDNKPAKASKKMAKNTASIFAPEVHPDDVPASEPAAGAKAPFVPKKRIKVEAVMSSTIDRVVVILEEVKAKMKNLPKMQNKPNQHNAKSASAAKTALAKLKAKGGSKHKVQTSKSAK